MIFPRYQPIYQRYAERHQQKNQKQPQSKNRQETHQKSHIPFSTLSGHSFYPAEATGTKCRYPLPKQPTAGNFPILFPQKPPYPTPLYRCPIECRRMPIGPAPPPAVHGNPTGSVPTVATIKTLPSPSVFGDFL